MKKLVLILAVCLLMNTVTAYAAVNFQIERVGYESTRDVAYNGEVCVAVGNRGQILASRDFINWEYCNTQNYTLFFNNVFWTGNFFIALSNPVFGECNLYTSYNGIDWEFKSILDISNTYQICSCFILDDRRIFLGLSDTKSLNQFGWLITDYKDASDRMELLSYYTNEVPSFDTKGGVEFKRGYSTIIKDNGEEYPLPKGTHGAISVPSKGLYYDQTKGFETELNGVPFTIGLRDIDAYYTKTYPYQPPLLAPYVPLFYMDYFKETLGDDVYWVQTDNYFAAYKKSSPNRLYVYDCQLNLVRTKDFEKPIGGIFKREDRCAVRLLDSINPEGEKSYTYLYSRDYTSWAETENLDQLPKSVLEYEKVFENNYLTQASKSGQIGWWNLLYDEQNKKTRLLSDGIYGIDLNIPFKFREYYEPGRFLFWEEGDQLCIQDGVVRLTTPKQAFYDTVKSTLNKPYVILNDKVLCFDVPPEIENDRILVPMRFLFEQMGAEVDWDNDTQTATVLQESDEIAFQINNLSANVNSQPQTMDVPARLINDKTMIPLRFLSENLGYTVEWDGVNNMAIITEDSPQ